MADYLSPRTAIGLSWLQFVQSRRGFPERARITVPEGTKTKRDIGTMTVPGGLFAVATVEIDLTQYGEAWDRLIGEWMPRSGYQPDDRMCYELYLNDPEKHPKGRHIVEICEPIRAL